MTFRFKGWNRAEPVPPTQFGVVKQFWVPGQLFVGPDQEEVTPGGGLGGSVGREQLVLTAADGANSQPFRWSVQATNGDPHVGIDPDWDPPFPDHLVFSTESLWAIELYYDISCSGGNVTGVDVAFTHQFSGPTGTDIAQDALFKVEPQATYENQWNVTWWFDEGDDITIVPGWTVDAGSAVATAELWLTRLA